MTQPVPGDNWNYSGNPSASELDEVRFLSQDSDPEMPWLTDTEVGWLITKWKPLYNSTTYVASIVAAVIARKLAGLARISAGNTDVDLSGMSERFRTIAADLRSEYLAEGDFGEPDLTSILLGVSHDSSITPLNFGIGMHDNPEAGWQNAGGWLPSLYPWVSESVGA